jgi:hypothetical protein
MSQKNDLASFVDVFSHRLEPKVEPQAIEIPEAVRMDIRSNRRTGSSSAWSP